MAKEHKKKRWWEYEPPIWLSGTYVMYIIVCASVLANLSARGSPHFPLFAGLFIIGGLILILVNYLWALKKSKSETLRQQR